jgi:hypothetical protein
MEGGGDLPEAPAVPPSVADGPVVKGGADGAQSFFGEEGRPEVRSGRKFGVVVVLFRQLIAAVVDGVLEVGADWHRRDGVPAGADLLASRKETVRWHEQVERRHLVHHRHCEEARP